MKLKTLYKRRLKEIGNFEDQLITVIKDIVYVAASIFMIIGLLITDVYGFGLRFMLIAYALPLFLWVRLRW